MQLPPALTVASAALSTALVETKNELCRCFLFFFFHISELRHDSPSSVHTLLAGKLNSIIVLLPGDALMCHRIFTIADISVVVMFHV